MASGCTSVTRDRFCGVAAWAEKLGESEPQMLISRQGDEYLRILLVRGADYILGPFAALGTEALGARRKKRQEASGGGAGAQAGGTAASAVGKRRGVRTIA